ncbi:MAG: hypothetical protein V1672_05560 [Candidatus Diapherotrites archaeon]
MVHKRKLLPVHALKISKLLEKGKGRKEIADIMERDHNLNPVTVATFVSRHFSKAKIGEAESIEALLWEWRGSVKSKYDTWKNMSKSSRKASARMTPEARSERGRKRARTMGKDGLQRARQKQIETMGPEGLKRAALKRVDTIGSEFSKIAQTREAGMSAEAKSARAIKGAETLGTEGRKARAKKGMDTLGSEGRSARAIKSAKTVGSERRSEMKKLWWSKLTKAERSAIIRKQWEGLTPKERSQKAIYMQAGMTAEDFSARAIKREASMPADVKTARAQKAADTRRRKKYGHLLYLEKLPELYLLNESEVLSLYKEKQGILISLTNKFRRREDYEDITTIGKLGVFEAFIRWDKKMNLNKLIEDCIKYNLIKYFSEDKGYMLQQLTRFAESDAKEAGLKTDKLWNV